MRILFFNRRTDPLKGLENVHEWEPSRRPRYQHRTLKTVYALDKVLPDRVILRKTCGKTLHVNKAEFLRSYRRV